MIGITRPDVMRTHALFMAAFLAGAVGLGLLQGMLSGTPTNATAKTNGNGWQCDPGYLEIGAGCAADMANMPAGQDRSQQAAARYRGNASSLTKELVDLRKRVEYLPLENTVLRAEIEDDY